jgi:hypothetical protein
MGDAGLQMAFFCAPMLTTIKVAPLRGSKNTIFAAA